MPSRTRVKSLAHRRKKLLVADMDSTMINEECIDELAAAVGLKAGDVLVFGHTHKPWHREVEGVHFVNTGTLGRPKDGDWRAGYVLLDMSGETPQVEFVRVEYDLERAMEGILRSELPDDFAEYLRTGGMPKPAATSADAG